MNVLDIKNVSFSYDDRKILEDISFSVEKGDVISILGSNGTGKTTLIKCLNGLYKIDSGDIFIRGQNIKKLSFKEISKFVGYIPQNHDATFPFNVLDVVIMGRAPYLCLNNLPKEKDTKIALSSLKTLGIEHLKDKEYTNLSGGERQLVFLARVLTQQPDLLILDEPTSHLDFGNQIKLLEILDELAKKGLSVVMTSHFPDHTFLSSNKVFVMKNGSFIGFGKPEEVVTEETLKKVYGLDVRLMDIEDGRKVCVPLKSNLKLDYEFFSR